MAKTARRKGKGVGCLVLRGRTWFARWVVAGKTYTRTTGTGNKETAEGRLKEFTAPHRLGSEVDTLAAVAVKIAGRKAEIAVYEDNKPATKIMHGWQAYLDQNNRPDSGDSTLRQYEFQYEAFAKWFKDNYPEQLDRDDKPIAWELRHVTQEHADRYAGHLLKNVGASTFNRHIVLLALVWRVLEKSARLSLNPWKAIGRKRFAVKSRRELTVEELGNVFNKAQGEMRLLLALGTFCGLRLGDAACLEWSNVDLVKGIISLIPRKTARRAQKRVTLPIHRTLFAMLSEIPKALRRGFVMPTLCERYNSFGGALAKDVADLFLSVNIKTNANAQTKAEKDAEEKAKTEGTQLPKAKATGKRASADCGFHSLRHTFVSLCAAGGVSQSVVQSLVGHGSPAMTQHYTHIDVLTAQNAVAMIPDVTHINIEENAKDAARAKLALVLSMLDGFDAEQLRELLKRAKAALKAKNV